LLLAAGPLGELITVPTPHADPIAGSRERAPTGRGEVREGDEGKG